MRDRWALVGRGSTWELRELAARLRQHPTPAEEILWKAVRANRLGGWHFRRQHVIERWIVDFYCHRARLVVEVDGEIHDQQPERDVERQASLERLGLSVMRFTNAEVQTSHMREKGRGKGEREREKRWRDSGFESGFSNN